MKKIQILLFALWISLNPIFAQFGSENEISNSLTKPNDIFACDLDGDGDLDILSGSYADDKIVWYENLDGTGIFGEQKVISEELFRISNLSAEDMDGDGDLDVISSSFMNQVINWYENLDGLGHFSEAQQINSQPFSPTTFKAVDIDADGDIDILCTFTNFEGLMTAGWMENEDGQGSFGLINPILETNNSEEYAKDIIFTDLDGDDDDDVAIIFSGSLLFLENSDGLGNFSEAIPVAWGDFRSIICYDFENDGDQDLFVSHSSGYIALIENDGNANFEEMQVVFSMLQHSIGSFSISDFDGDEDGDVLCSISCCDKLYWNENIDGMGNMGDNQLIEDSLLNIKKAISADLDNDGDMDIISCYWANDQIVWYNNSDGYGNFSGPIDIYKSDMYLPISSQIVDIDGDGYMDVLSCSEQNNKVLWYKSIDGQGNFQNQQTISDSVLSVQSVFSIDIDGDNDMDILVTSFVDNTVGWFENLDGLGDFSELQIITDQAIYTSFVTAQDLDSDGDMDVISASKTSNFIYWYENLDGLGNFSDPNIITDQVSQVDYLEVIDFDNDGDYDIIVSEGENNTLDIFENSDASNEFIAHQIITGLGSQFTCRAFARDLDNDGDFEIILEKNSWDQYSISWFENLNGTYEFGSEQIIASGFTEHIEISFSDLDSDNDIDILYSSPFGFFLLENLNESEEFSDIQILKFNQIMQNYSSFQVSDLDSDGDDDLLLSNYNRLVWFENFSSGSEYQISGHSFFDENQNGILDDNEYGFSNFQTNLSTQGLASFTNEDGEYWYAIDTNNYTVTFQELENWALTTDSSEYHANINSSSPIAEDLDFGFYPEAFVTNINPEISHAQGICGSETTAWLTYSNVGTTQPDGIIEYILDPQVTFISSDIEPDSIVGQHLYWSFDSLQYFSSGMFVVNSLLPDFNSMGDNLNYILNIYTTDSTGDFTFTDSLSSILACSYDPNDKLVTPVGEGELGIVSKDETLEYTIRFQNTGNAEAINIQVRDQLDGNLDFESIQILASSDELRAYTEQGRWLVFQFDSIMLPDSTTNELASHGFIKFSINIKEDVLPNAQIHNTAYIHFDYNMAVVTNTTINTVECYIAPEVPVITLDEGVLSIESDHEIHWFKDGIEISDATLEELPVSENGNYMVLLIDENGCQTSSDVYSVMNIGMDVLDSLYFKLYPNPADETIIIESENIEAMHYQIYNIHSQLILEDVMQNGKSQIDVSSLSTGLYIVRLGSQSIKLTIK